MSFLPGSSTALPGEAAWQALPYGLVALTEEGQVTAANPAARELAWPAADDDETGGMTCASLFACRTTRGPCRSACLVQRAGRAATTLPEIRIDLPTGRGASALWVTLTGLGSQGGVLAHLRPAEAADRRRRSAPHWISGPQLIIKALGRIRVDSPEGPLGGAWLGQRRGQILKYLVCQRERVVPAEEIAEALWPHSGRQGLSSVRHFVHTLREHLEPGRPAKAASSFILTVRDGYALNRQRVSIDIDAFTASVSGGLRAATDGEATRATELLEIAVSHYRGDLLEDEPYTDWVLPERDRLRAMACESLRVLSSLATGRGDTGAASAHLMRLADLEPFDSDVQRQLLRVLLEQGRRTEALRRYHTFRVRLEREFQQAPDFRLSDLTRR